ncbi:MAG: DNA-binding protein WhiA [Tissierellia bacterium]|nr:DNA-binding protein WhiA [Tissierellia bacterium]
MSFTKTVKDESCRIRHADPNVLLAELSAIARINGTLYTQSFQEPRIRFTTSNYSVARRIFFLLKETVKQDPLLLTIQNPSGKRKLLQIALDDQKATLRLLQAVGMIQTDGMITARVPSKQIWGPRRSAAFLRGAFLVAGYIAAPEKAAHLEIEAQPLMAQTLVRIFKKFDIDAKLYEKKETGVYVKDGDAIAMFLRVIETHQSLLRFEDERAMKDIRNQINRRINFETANLDKTVDASMKQLAIIQQLQEGHEWERLDPRLRELAYLRLKNPSASLKELGEMLDPPVSKSTVNHRFRKLMQMADEPTGQDR